MTKAGNQRGSGPYTARFVLFDLDGTLIDTAPDLAYCVDQMLIGMGLPPRGEQMVRLWIGNGAERLVKRALTGQMNGEPAPEALAQAFSAFNALYRQHAARASQPYPGVTAMLNQLTDAGFRLGCVTNKPRIFSEMLLNSLRLTVYFHTLVCGDDLPHKKPHPLPLLHACGQLDGHPSQGVMVGDSKSDVHAAKAAGMPVICVNFGYNHGEDVSVHGPDSVIASFQELPSLVCCDPLVHPAAAAAVASASR